ncbi:MAG TPA: hypothetical protein VLG46_17320, partial [Anaerolineae bacterium]|nr:hypothetical protein [Anaerolineae bacterium]
MNLFFVSARVLRSLALIMGVSLATGVSGALPAEKHPFGLDDYSALRRARAVSVSPDGRTILYVVSRDGDKGPTKEEWRLIDVSGENSRKLELSENFKPAGFLKDGAALFGLYEVEKKQQLAIVPIASGKPMQIVAMPNGIRAAVISPDGMRFAMLADPRPSDALAPVRRVVENDVTSVYVTGVSGEEGAWWCPELKSVVDIAWAPDGARVAVVTQT